MNDQERYYRSRGGFNPIGLMIMFVAGTIAAAALAIVYALICMYNPFIYFTFIGTFVFGFSVGWVVKSIGKATKVRSRGFSAMVGLLCGGAAAYLAWMAFIFMFDYDMRALTLSPLAVFRIITALGEEGIWDFRGAKPTGAVLYGIWSLEAGIVLVVALLTASSNDAPFCENCDQWIEPQGEPVPLPNNGQLDQLQRDLEAENYRAFDDLAAGKLEPSDFLNAIIKTCPSCSDSNFLSVDRVVTTTKSSGEEDVNTATLLANLSIPTTVIEQLRGIAERPADEQADADESESLEHEHEEPAEDEHDDSDDDSYDE